MFCLEYPFLASFIVTVSEDNCTNSTDPSLVCTTFNNVPPVTSGVILNLNCANQLLGRYVTIRRQPGSIVYLWNYGTVSSMELCNVVVTGFLYTGKVVLFYTT